MYVKKRAVAATAAAAAAALALSACGGLSAGSGDSGAAGDSGGPWPTVKVGGVGVQSDIKDVTAFCGTKPIKVGYADGNANNTWRKATIALFQAQAAKCPNITQVKVTDAQNNTQKAISDINSMVAQGVNVIVTFGDAGQALLPAIRKANEAGVAVVPIVSGIGGTPGKDYVDFVAEDVEGYGTTLADWAARTMGGKGNLVMLGGVAGSAYSQTVYDGVKKAVAAHPDIRLLNPDGYVATDWDVSKTQQVVAGLITKHGKIDGIVSDFGGGSVGGIRAFIAADKPLPVWAANDSNEFAGLWHRYHKRYPSYQIATESSRNWVVQAALNKGLAAYNGIDNDEPSTYKLEIIEDSTNPKLLPRHDKSLPADAILSSGLTTEQIKELYK
ncbi:MULTISPECIES: substrate-binding domain-containing protein [unclassified Streptomyces]|uniref:substrate-binding domain-containing protein n=1 Tax=unclassified Streptomyces TaxID=2593676 RepID=UPI00223809F1|nr:substrate-binding domain-containing protein [Streptomyces sp. SHP 1-2]MCW5251386.1 substrate-binding domain-containing protein [Streptomyces sp. SHP 1-2]